MYTLPIRVLFASTVLITVLPTCVAHADPLKNGSFTSGDASGWTTAGHVRVDSDQHPSDSTNSANLETGFIARTSIETALDLRSGTIDSLAGVRTTYGSYISQSITANAGQTLTFEYLFTPGDYLPYSDTAFYSLGNDTGAFLLGQVNLAGPRDSTSWKTASFTFKKSGTYLLGYGVVNAVDNEYQSFLRVTNVQIVPETGTLFSFGIVLGMGGIFTWHRRVKRCA